MHTGERQMTDVQETGEAEPSTVLRVQIPKAKTFIEVETDRLPTHVYQEALVQGLKALLIRGQTTFTKEKYPDPDELQAASLEKTKATLEDLYAGKVTIRGASKDSKVPREVMTAARNIARKMVKEILKRRGVKVTQVKSSDITKAANSMLAANPHIIEKARKEIEDIEKDTNMDLDMDIQEDPKLVAAQAKKKTDKTLSAKQADRVTSRVQR
jgi:hypothetical protein